MNYVVLDLEWNQCPYGKAQENEQLPFEIIQIGAAKLNEKKELQGTFQKLIRPTVYKKMNFYSHEVTNISMKDLAEGERFQDAAKEFFVWCGENYRFCTWGTLDLLELQKNLFYYGIGDLLPGPVIYEDVQSLYGIQYETPATKRALKDAVLFLGMEENGAYHHALDDAVYTANVLKTIPDEVILDNYTVDCFQNPKKKEDEIHIRYDTYERYISREFDSREALMQDREVSAVRCFTCGKNVKRRVTWFSDGGRNYYAVGCCPDHGYVKCRVRVQMAEDGKFFADKTTRIISREEAKKISSRQSDLRIRRQKKRKK